MNEAKLTQNLEKCGLKMNYLIMIMVARKVAIAAMDRGNCKGRISR
jgi:hypothetical protein